MFIILCMCIHCVYVFTLLCSFVFFFIHILCSSIYCVHSYLYVHSCCVNIRIYWLNNRVGHSCFLFRHLLWAFIFCLHSYCVVHSYVFVDSFIFAHSSFWSFQLLFVNYYVLFVHLFLFINVFFCSIICVVHSYPACILIVVHSFYFVHSYFVFTIVVVVHSYCVVHSLLLPIQFWLFIHIAVHLFFDHSSFLYAFILLSSLMCGCIHRVWSFIFCSFLCVLFIPLVVVNSCFFDIHQCVCIMIVMCIRMCYPFIVLFM